jgi:hypothetical protein
VASSQRSGGAALVTRAESVLVKKAFAAAFILRALSPLYCWV